jgi:virginiamycin B lyase
MYRVKVVRTLLVGSIAFLVGFTLLTGLFHKTYAQSTQEAAQAAKFVVKEFDVPSGAHPHDVAPAPDGTVWYTAQNQAALGRLDPKTGKTHHVALGSGARPHGVIIGPDNAAWVTDGGLNAIVRVDDKTEAVKVFRLPSGTPNINMNTAAFDGTGILWYTGQSGYYGSVDPKSGEVKVYQAPRGRGPYGITATPDGDVYYASLAGNHIAKIDLKTGEATPIDPPTERQGARRVWSDSKGKIWVSEYNSGQISVYDPETKKWQEWKVPGDRSAIYAVYVDDQDMIWMSNFGTNELVRFDPTREAFDRIPLPSPGAAIRQILGRPGEVWGAESGADKLIVIYTGEQQASGDK